MKLDIHEQRNIELCRKAMVKKQRIGVLALMRYTTGVVDEIWFDDFEEQVVLNTDSGTKRISASTIAAVNLL